MYCWRPSVSDSRALHPNRLRAYERLCIHRLAGLTFPRPVGECLERPAAQVARNRGFDQIEHRRDDIGHLDEVGDPAPGVRAAGLLDDERDVNRFVVQEQSVFLFAVVAQPFAVVRDEHDRGLIVELAGLEVPHEAAEDFVRVGDGAVVGSQRAEPLGRRVRRVRLVQMQKQEEPGRADRGQPAFGDGL